MINKFPTLPKARIFSASSILSFTSTVKYFGFPGPTPATTTPC
ncbi:hypothetical protein [Tissierella simiarum]|nr:hypothetical protein [Tissierella simiarum]